MSQYTMTTNHAAMFLAIHARKLNPALLLVDWHSFLRENRRDPASDSAVARRSARGNSHLFGMIRHLSTGRKVMYSKIALLEFLEKLKLNPSLVDYLVRKVGD